MNLQGDSYLELQIDPNTMALLAMVNIQEVINTSTVNVVPVPNMTANVLGLLNHRSQVYWVMDLGQILGLSPLDTSITKYAVAILSIEQTVMAIALPMIKAVQQFSRDRIQNPPTDTLKTLVPYLEGCVIQANQSIPILNPIALLKSQSC
jgi:positive phototaxis protein PixI